MLPQFGPGNPAAVWFWEPCHFTEDRTGVGRSSTHHMTVRQLLSPSNPPSPLRQPIPAPSRTPFPRVSQFSSPTAFLTGVDPSAPLPLSAGLELTPPIYSTLLCFTRERESIALIPRGHFWLSFWEGGVMMIGQRTEFIQPKIPTVLRSTNPESAHFSSCLA